MSTLTTDMEIANAIDVQVTAESLKVNLDDGRTVYIPLGWFPRLFHGTEKERNNWRLIGHGEGIHWDDLDEDISMTGLLAGHRSGETRQSLQRWLESRRKRGA
jgi:hypothetical protein